MNRPKVNAAKRLVNANKVQENERSLGLREKKKRHSASANRIKHLKIQNTFWNCSPFIVVMD